MHNINWENKVVKQLQEITNNLSKSQKSKYQVELLERLITRVGEFSKEDCAECLKFKETIKSMLIQIKDINTNHRKEFNKNLTFLLNHLKEEHGLYTANENKYILMSSGISVGLAFGTGLGITFGLALGIEPRLTFGAALPIGSGLGMVIGMIAGILMGDNKDKRNREKGKII